jgi:hypothetical protein
MNGEWTGDLSFIAVINVRKWPVRPGTFPCGESYTHRANEEQKTATMPRGPFT